MHTKRLSGRVEVKDADKGTVAVVFATLGVKDLDGDVTVKGAFEDGAPVVISAYGHKSWDGKLPVGTGEIREVKNEAVMDGQFLLDTAAGADTFITVKALAEKGLGEWSYGYDAVKYSFGEHEGERVRFLEQQKVHEVSPVLLGAGINTRTLAAKSAGDVRFAEHVKAVTDDLDDLIDRAVRAAKGKTLRDEPTTLLQLIDSKLKRLSELLASGQDEDPEDPTDEALKSALAAEHLRFLRATSGL